MSLLTDTFVAIVSKEDRASLLAIGTMFAAMLVLPAAGAVLKRWEFHQRHRETDESVAFGCLCNPIVYFCVSLTIASALGTLFASQIFGRHYPDQALVFVPMLLGIIVVCIVQTVLVYRYLSPPRTPPSGFLRDPRAALVGDVCVFLNMILFQILWNLVGQLQLGRVSGVAEFVGRLFFITFVSLLIYFPPRLFYLAEDARRPMTWATMLLANAPIIARVVWGSD